jgi:hypothetical protein
VIEVEVERETASLIQVKLPVGGFTRKNERIKKQLNEIYVPTSDKKNTTLQST